MTTVCNDEFVDCLYRLQLLTAEQFTELEPLRAQCSDAKSLGRRLIELEWLTPYQVNQLMQNKGDHTLRIGPYVILGRLGEGGMGQVFKARHLPTQRIVAVKVLRPNLLTNEIAVRRFQREVRALFQLDHPNIVRAIDAGEADGQHFVAMEYIEGVDLAKMVKKTGPLNVRQACEYIRQAAMALQHASQQGLVHRDIKPGNLLITESVNPDQVYTDPFDRAQAKRWGLVKVLDLGLARIISEDEEAATTLLTQMNVVMGTPDFISPEQALNSHNTDTRSDLYSLGCTMYFLLAGKPPFPRGTATEKLLAHRLDRPEPVEEVRRRELIARGANPNELKYLSSKVGRLVRKLMAKRPAHRLQSPEELVELLTRILSADGGSLRSGKRSRPVRNGNGSPAFDADDAVGDNEPFPLRNEQDTPSGKSWFPRARYVAIALLAGIVVFAALAAISHEDPQDPPPDAVQPKAVRVQPSPKVQALDPEWAKIQEEIRKRTDLLKLWDSLLAYRVRYPDSPHANQVAKLFLELPSPLDHLKGEGKEDESLPKDVVAVLINWRGVFGNSAARSVAFSPSLHYVAAGWDRVGMQVWSTDTIPNAPVLMRGFRATVRSIDYSPDGRFLAAGTAEGTVGIREVGTGEFRVIRDVRSNVGVVALGFTADAGGLILVRESGHLVVLNPETKRAVQEPFWSGFRDIRLAAIADRWAVLAGPASDNVLALQIDEPFTTRHRITVRTRGEFASVALSNDARLLLVGDTEGQVLCYERKDRKFEPARGFRNRSAVTSIAVAPEGSHFVVGTKSGSVVLWDYENRFSPVKTVELKTAIRGLDFAPDGRHVAAAGADGRVYILRLAPPPEQQPH